MQSLAPSFPHAKRALGVVLSVIAMIVSLVTFTPRAAAQPVRNAEITDVADIASFITETTVGVIRIDLTQVDPAAIIDDLRRAFAGAMQSNPKGARDLDAELVKAGARANEWKERFIAAGGKNLYVLVVLKFGHELPIVLVAPTSAPSKLEAMKGVLAELPGLNQAIRISRSAVLAAESDEVMEGLPQPPSARAVELAKALIAAGEAPIQGAFIPAQNIRKALVELAPQLPERLGGGPSTTLTDGARWGSFALHPAPAWSAKVTIQSADPAAATAFVNALTKIYAMLAADPRLTNLTPGLDRLLQTCTPKVDGDTIVLTLSAADFNLIKTALAPSLIRARQATLEIVSATNVRAIMQGCFLYAANNKDEFPPDLETLMKSGFIGKTIVVNPSAPERRPAYIYRRPSPEQMIQSNIIVVHESFDEWPEAGIWVGYVNAHVARIIHEATFNEQIARRNDKK